MIEGRVVMTGMALALLAATGWLPAGERRSRIGSIPIDQGFLSLNYEDMELAPREKGFDLVYVAPGAFERIGEYDGIMIDQPEVWVDRTSDYPGTKPDYLKAIVDLVRDKMTGALVRGGHDVVEAPGPRVAFIRVGIDRSYI